MTSAGVILLLAAVVALLFAVGCVGGTPSPDADGSDISTEEVSEPMVSDDIIEADTAAEVITLPSETVPEPETEAKTMPRLDIYTDDGRDVSSKEHYKHATATLSECDEVFAFENVGVNIRARGNSTFHAPKKPFRLKFDQKQEMLGLNGGNAYKSWVLMADYYDGSIKAFANLKVPKVRSMEPS